MVQNLDDNTVWWEKLDKNPPKHALNWKGEPWDGSDGTPGAHPNSRFTAPSHNCPCLSPEYENPNGVPISAIIFGGRRAKTAPLVYQSRDWAHGVFVGSVLASETTAAATGAVGVVRRDPMAMRPFIGYHVGTDDEGNFLWPGFGDNMRVLLWILARCEGKVSARETEIGYLPYVKDIDIEGLENDGKEFTHMMLDELLSVDKALWREDAENIEGFYTSIGERLPAKLHEELETLKKNLE